MKFGVYPKKVLLCAAGNFENSESGITTLQPLGQNVCPPGAPPWQSSRGYEVTDDGWILSSTRKRLLWLPHRWRSEKRLRMWNGQFLGLRHAERPPLREIVIPSDLVCVHLLSSVLTRSHSSSPWWWWRYKDPWRTLGYVCLQISGS